MRGITQALYDPTLLGLLPTIVEQLSSGATTVLDGLGASLLGGAADAPEGLAASVNCAERAMDAAGAALAELRLQRPISGPGLPSSICPIWRVPAVGQEFRTVERSTVPTLVLAGEFDPATPATGSRDVSIKLGATSTFIEFAGLSHGVVGTGPCADAILTAFIIDPAATIDASCAALLPEPM